MDAVTFVRDSLRQLLRDPSIASKNWVYRQYDHMVRTGTVVWPGSDAAVFHVREANKILAATTDCNSLYCRLDPREGARIAVAEAARNLTCSGARPLAVTDNLNFGNPYKPEISGNCAKRWKASRKRAALSARRSPAAMSLYTMKARPAWSIRRRPSRWSA